MSNLFISADKLEKSNLAIRNWIGLTLFLIDAKLEVLLIIEWMTQNIHYILLYIYDKINSGGFL